jgi:catechol 2,3-dioxygenase-like lactoylglutathione lyase family enzyme
MIDHVTIPVKSLELSKTFYEKALLPLAYKIVFGEEDKFWAFHVGNGSLFEIAQYNGQTPITPVHIAFRLPDVIAVNDFYNAAITAGGKDNGAPGPRPQYTENYYACFICDLDGHNIEAMCDKPLIKRV